MIFECPYLKDVINEHVTNIRQVANVVSISETGTLGTYSLVVNSLKDFVQYGWVTISGTTNFNGSFQVKTIVTATRTMTFTTTTGKATETTGTVTNNAPYFFTGTFKEISGILQELAQVVTNQNKRFPAILLRIPYKSDMKDQDGYIFGKFSFDLVIVYPSDVQVEFDTRQTIFKNYLDKIYVNLLTELEKSKYFSWPDGVDCVKQDHYFKSEAGKTQNALAEICEAIELNFNNVILKHKLTTFNT